MNILYISYDGMTDPLGQSQVIPYLKDLAEIGHEITILSFEKDTVFLNNKYQISVILNKNRINWVPLQYHTKPPLVSTLFDVFKMWNQAKKLHQQNNFDIVHCRSYISSLVGLKLKKKYGVKFVFDMRGFWSDERVEGGLWHLKNPVFRQVYKYFKRKEIEFLTHSDAIISLTENARKEMGSWKGVNVTEKIKVIPCCVDTDLFCASNQNKEELKNDLDFDKDTFVLTYLGSIGTWYMLDEMLAFFKVLKSQKLNAKFLFLTNESSDVIFDSACKIDISEEDLIVKSVRREEVPKYLQITDISIFFIMPSFSKKASSPTKMGEILSMGVPIICNSGIGDVNKIMDERKAGVLIKEFTDLAYREAILEFDNSNFINLRNVAIDKFSLSKGVVAYDEVYCSL